MEKLIKIYKSLRTYFRKLVNSDSKSTYIEFDDFFWSERITNFFGFNNLPRVTHLARSRERKVFFALSMVISVVFLIINVISIAYGLAHSKSLLVIIENVAIICIEGLVLIKGFTIMYWRREKIMNIIVKLKDHFPQNAWDQHVFQVADHLKTLRICITIGSVLYNSVLVEFTSMPVLILLYELIFSHEIKLELVIQLELPVDTSDSLTYAVLYVINTWSFIVGTFTILITDLLFAELLTVINLELMALAQLISEIDPSEGQDESIKELKKLSEVHQELNELSENLKDILSPLLFIESFGMLVTISCCAFMTLSGISTYFMLKYILTLIVTMWNSFLHCFYGSRLNDASLSVADGAYSCNWAYGTNKFKKIILMIMVRAQKIQELTGMEFVNVNLETYQWIIRAAYSYYSVLSAVYKS